MSHRLTITAAVASAAASTGLYPLLSGGKWFGAGLGAIIVVAAIGTATRARAVRALPASVCLLAALAGLLLYLNLADAAKSSFGHVLPTAASLTELWRLTVQGIRDARIYAAPVQPLPGIVVIATAGIGLVAALTDLIAVRLRQAALAGLPLLVLFSIPVATGAGKDALTDTVVFCLGVAGYLALLSADSQERLRLWGRLVTPWNPGRDEPGRDRVSGTSTRALSASGRRIGVAAIALALVTPLLIPGLQPHKLFPSTSRGTGLGSGLGGGQALDPLVLMNRQLLETKPTVVLTYQASASPGYLQMAVLGTLSDSGWSMSRVRPVRVASPGTLPAVPGLTTRTWRTVRTTIQIRPNGLPGDAFLPLPYPARQLDVSGGGWQADAGTLDLYNTAQSVSGLTYAVSSLDVTPSPGQLTAAPAGAGPMSAYLAVPASYRSLRPLAQRIARNARTPGAAALALQGWFLAPGRFKYSLSPNLPAGAAGVADFLNKSRTGFCQQFAFAMAVLARLLGIPSRVVVGYTAGASVGAGRYVVMSSDAHAWPELYFNGFGWLRMEPTPGGTARGQGTAVIPAYTQTGTGGGTGPGTGGSVPSGAHNTGKHPQPRFGVGVRGGIGAGGAPGSAPRAGGGNGLGAALIVLAALLAVALVTPRATRSLIRRRRWLAARGDASRAHAAWLELLDDLTDYGIGHRPGETPRAVAKRVTAQIRLIGSAREALLRITEAEERASYAREPRPAGQLRGDVTTVRGAVRAAVPRPARWRGRLVPVSAADRARSWLSHALDVFGWLEVASARLRHRLGGRRTAEQG